VIYEDIEHPNDRLEEWAFSFVCSASPTTGARVVSSMNLTGGRHSQTITMDQAKVSLGPFIQDLATICNEILEPLPEVAMLTIDIQYTVDQPQDYIPSGFGKPVSVPARFPNTEDWEKTTTVVGR
jgi:hypothetical protein